MERNMAQQYLLNEGFKALLRSIFEDEEKSAKLIQAFEEVVNDRATMQRINLENLKEKALEEIRNELATKDLLTAEINRIEAKIEAEVAKLDKKITTEVAKLDKKIDDLANNQRITNQRITFYSIGISALIVLFQPKVFEFISNLFK